MSVREHLLALAGLARRCADDGALCAQIEAAAHALARVLLGGGTVYACGNGGSAATAQHFAGELIGRYVSDRTPLRSVCLNADTAVLTCIANDYGYERAFARQVRGLVTSGDALVCFSTSGTSQSVREAALSARRRGAPVVGIVGAKGRETWAPSSHVLPIVIDSTETARVQEVSECVMHALVDAIEREVCV